MNLFKIKDSMKDVARMLIPQSYPYITPQEEFDEGIVWLKTRLLMIDGYQISLYYNISLYQNIELHSIQLASAYAPFLPFHIVCKLAKLFLDFKFKNLIRINVNQRVTYCWHSYLKNGLEFTPFLKNPMIFGDFEYYLMKE